MTLGDFMDILGRLHKLTPAQRRAVAEVLAEPEEVQRPAAAAKSLPVAGKPQNHGKPIDDYERHEFMRFAAVCQRMPLRKRSRIYNEASRAMGRSYDSVRCEVLKAIKELKKSTETQKERSQ
jgi:hypothetical protein